MKLTTVVIFCSMAAAPFGVHADPLFSYESAAEAFDSTSASAPAPGDLAGQWLRTGKVSAPELEHRQDGYWPDGNFHAPGYQGHFKNIATITEATDGLGNAVASFTDKLIGSESGRVYEHDGVFTGPLEKTGFRFDIPGNRERYSDFVECRFVQNKNSLLCKLHSPDYRGAIYQEYVRLP